MIGMLKRLHGDVETVQRTAMRWGGAALCVVVAHVGAAFAVLHWPKPVSTAGEPPAAIMIEFAPLPAAPDVPEQNLAVAPQSAMAETSTPSEVQEEPEEKTESDQPPEPQPEAKTETETEQQAEIKTEVETPELPTIETAEAVLEAPKPPEPAPEPREEEKPPEKPKKSEKKSKPQDKSAQAKQLNAAPKPVTAPRAKTNLAAVSGMSSSMSPATWRGMVVAHMNRRKRSPGGPNGTASVAFTIDRGGRVLSARLIRSSGNPALDREAVALAHRASPVPAPPAQMMKGSSVTLTVPVRAR